MGLWIDPTSFIEFVSDLDHYLNLELTCNHEETARVHYPVGQLGPVRIYFEHYASFAEAQLKWNRRATRVNLENVALIFTDRDGATEQHIRAFCALPVERKIVFAAREHEDCSCVVVVPGYAASAEIGDLYTEWDRLYPILNGPRLQLLA